MMSYRNPVVGRCLMLIVFTCWFNAKCSEAFETFGFDIHHRYSDAVKEFLNVDGLPEKGTVDYYSAMVHRDRHLMSRRLAASTPPLTFFGGTENSTYLLSSLGYLHYSIVSVGTPALTFLAALDTANELSWLPCDCITCPRSFNLSSGKPFKLNIYSPSTSRTSVPLPCTSSMCGPKRGCSKTNACSYVQVYGSSSSTGILVNDVLHLGTDTTPQDLVDATIMFGCGVIQTGDFLDSIAINGLFGLGMGSISVPSILANKGVTSNSFSMCFGPDGIGRIEFGDKGSPDQQVTPFNIDLSNPSYNVTVTQIALGKRVSNIEFTASFDTSTSFAYLSDPAYTVIVQGFDSQITEARYVPPRKLIFDYCYSLSATQESYTIPDLTFTMKGGSKFLVTAPTIVIPRQGGYAYCLAIVKSVDINSIGQNFMTGYRLVFDREEMVLGWKESNCYDSISSNAPPVNKGNPSPPSPPSVFNPEPTPKNGTPSPVPSPSPPPPMTKPFFGKGNGAARLSSMTNGLVMVLLAVFALV